MKEYYDLLLNYPDWFITTSPLEMREFVEMNFRYFIDGKDKEGRPIYVCKIGKSRRENAKKCGRSESS